MTFIAVHKCGCVCLDCVTGETVPFESASRNDIADLLGAMIENDTGLSREQIIEYCALDWV